MPRRAVPSYFFVLVVVEHEGKFLMIREAKHGGGWYLPAGGVEPGETLIQAAIRETMEEAGVLIEPMGLLRFDQGWGGSEDSAYTRFRFTLLARAVGDTTPKVTPDEHSEEARWVALADAQKLRLRGAEVIELFALVAGGAAVLPMDRYQVL